MNDSPHGTSSRSPVLAILGSLVAGAALAVALFFTVGSSGSEPVVTGSVLFAFGLGWGLMAWLSTRFSARPQAWTAVPAAFLGFVGLGALLLRFTAPRLLAALVILAGVGYLADSIGTIVVADYGLTVSTFTFVGEALLIFWLFWRAARGSRSSATSVVTPDRASAAAAS